MVINYEQRQYLPYHPVPEGIESNKLAWEAKRTDERMDLLESAQEIVDR
jgi:hypothetical protein